MLKYIVSIIRLASTSIVDEGIVNAFGNKGFQIIAFETAMSAHPSAEVEKLPSVWLFAS